MAEAVLIKSTSDEKMESLIDMMKILLETVQEIKKEIQEIKEKIDPKLSEVESLPKEQAKNCEIQKVKSAFSFFYDEEEPKIKQSNPHFSQDTINDIISHKWKIIFEENKKKYFDMERYQFEILNTKEKPVPNMRALEIFLKEYKGGRGSTQQHKKGVWSANSDIREKYQEKAVLDRERYDMQLKVYNSLFGQDGNTLI